MDKTGLLEAADRLLGPAGSNRGYKNSVQLRTLVHLLHAQGNHVSDVKHLKKDALFGEVPSRQFLEAFLVRASHKLGAMERLLDKAASICMFVQPKPAPGEDVGRVVDICEQDDLCKKRCGVAMRVGEGLINTLVYDAATGTVLAQRLDPGNVGYGTGRTELLDDALRRLEGWGISLVRADAAYFNSGTINWCIDHGVDFVIRANLRRGREELLSNIDPDALLPVGTDSKGNALEAVSLPHVLGSCRHAMTLVACRRASHGGQRDLFGYKHFAIATSLYITPVELLVLYDQRGECCENRNKEFGSDLGSSHPPSSELGPNRVWMIVNAIAHNLLMMMRRLTHEGEQLPRLKRFALQVYQLSCRLVQSGGQYLLLYYNGGYDELMRWDMRISQALEPRIRLMTGGQATAERERPTPGA